MSVNNEFIDYLLELLEPIQPVEAKRMFGGCGLFKDGLMFALVSDQMLYLKADSKNKHLFEKMALEKFSYTRSGKLTYLSYYQAPIDALEDGEILARWAHYSIDAALRATDNTAR